MRLAEVHPGPSGRQLRAGCSHNLRRTPRRWLCERDGRDLARPGRGYAVITTPFSFFASVSAILRCGAQPLLADIDPATFNLSAKATEEVLRSHSGAKVKAILPVHLYGQCADWDAFTALKQNSDLLLVEDAAQAFGATWNGIPAGALGDAAAFSFYPTKNLSAMGDAGLVTQHARLP